MSARSATAVGVVLAMLSAGAIARADDPPPAASPVIDFNYARQLIQKERRGESLTPQERDYLARAREEYRRRNGRVPPTTQPDGRRGPGPTTRPDTPAPRASMGFKPLTEMTADDRYKGEDGGLYGGGRNSPADAHATAAAAAIGNITPLDAEGKPAADGKIVLISIGMSNTTQEFSRFKQLADADPAKRPEVVIVDGAQGGMDAASWDPTGNAGAERVWGVLADRLKRAGVTPQQVQAVWIKQALKQPAGLGAFPAHARTLRDHLVAILQLARQKYPNLRVAYLSSRIYAGYATGGLNPEPYAYESAFSVRWVILDQCRGDKALNCDPAAGEVKAPLVLWGPYLWSDGTTPRKADGLTYVRADLAGDGTHPSAESGRTKVARQLLSFFTADPLAKSWFARQAAPVPRLPDSP
ncbi:MAG: hypothetical protein BIFFINMI_01227 [Phycisphaerae bacterium]|nr:hypothetical protein [Phycisphaerae bacterium]